LQNSKITIGLSSITIWLVILQSYISEKFFCLIHTYYIYKDTYFARWRTKFHRCVEDEHRPKFQLSFPSLVCISIPCSKSESCTRARWFVQKWKKQNKNLFSCQRRTPFNQSWLDLGSFLSFMIRDSFCRFPLPYIFHAIFYYPSFSCLYLIIGNLKTVL
jgi:hypothetical protein